MGVAHKGLAFPFLAREQTYTCALFPRAKSDGCLYAGKRGAKVCRKVDRRPRDGPPPTHQRRTEHESMQIQDGRCLVYTHSRAGVLGMVYSACAGVVGPWRGNGGSVRYCE